MFLALTQDAHTFAYEFALVILLCLVCLYSIHLAYVSLTPNVCACDDTVCMNTQGEGRREFNSICKDALSDVREEVSRVHAC